jgi:predicted porin
MKKSLIALAALSTIAGSVAAQSSVTISGRLDQSYGFHDVGTAGQGKVAKVNSNVFATSRITFAGVEDLGGGLKAGFFLETGLSPDAGTAGSTSTTGQFFSRESNIYVSDAKLGELRVGKITTQATDSDVFVNATTSHVAGMNQALVGKRIGGVASTTATGIDSLGDNADNAIAYTSPVISGAQVQLFRAEGENAGGYDTGSVVGGSVRYTLGGLKATAANVSKKSSSGKTQDQTSYGVAYDFGVVRVGAVQVTSDYTETTANDKAKATVYSVAVPLTAKITAIGAYHTAKNDLGSAYDGKATVVGATYDFSKRTAAYVTYAASKNEASGNYSVSGMTGTTAGADEKLTSVGIKHFF